MYRVLLAPFKILNINFAERKRKFAIFHFTFSSTRSGIGIVKKTSTKNRPPWNGKLIIFVELIIDRSQERNKMKKRTRKRGGK